jgi:hypothetical protein
MGFVARGGGRSSLTPGYRYLTLAGSYVCIHLHFILVGVCETCNVELISL